MDEAMEQEDDAQKGASGQLATTKVPLAQSQPIVVPPLSSGATRLENVEADLMHWYCLDADAQTALLKSVSENDKFSHEALVHICRQAYEDKDK
ncbi:MAG: hypothetical protein P4L81_03610, partial [Candidatus Pacebacteria bacterium]|nr:hypothetical protein [Candidatus Paceibacterota bacterium]